MFKKVSEHPKLTYKSGDKIIMKNNLKGMISEFSNNIYFIDYIRSWDTIGPDYQLLHTIDVCVYDHNIKGLFKKNRKLYK